MSHPQAFPTFKEFLSTLALTSGANTFDYGLYLKELSAIHQFSHYSSTLVFLIDYQHRDYPFMSANALAVTGHPLAAFDEGGLEFSWHYNLDFNYLNKDIFLDRSRFFKENPDVAISDIRFSMGYRVKDAKGNTRSFLQRHTIIEMANDIQPLGVMGFGWDLTGQVEKTRIFHEIERFDHLKKQWLTAVSKTYFPDIAEDKLLTRRELEILKWVMDGLASKQIAERLHISIHTVNAHRKNMLRKTNCTNFSEIVKYAIKHDLL
jgi:DNA-binding CsgD family transcriptional regulator